MSKGNFVSLIRWFPTREKNSNFPFDIGSQYPSRWHNWTFPCEADSSLGRNVAKCVVQFPVTCVYSLFLEVKLDNFPTRDHPRAPCGSSSAIWCWIYSCSYYRNYNYGAASGSVGYNILADPDEVATNATLSFETALWFWTTPASPKPSCHNVMVGNWTPSSEDIADGREPGFGETINIINGGLECGTSSAAANNRITYYENFCSQLGVSPGSNVSCASATPYS
jgi:hypothetical protein